MKKTTLLIIAQLILFCAYSQGLKISQLPTATPLNGSELTLVVQGGVTKQSTVAAASSLQLTNWSSTKQYAAGNSVIFGNLIYTANTTPTLGNNPGGNSQWTLQIIDPAPYTGNGSWSGQQRAPTMNYVGEQFDSIYGRLGSGGAFLPLAGGTVEDSAGDESISTTMKTLSDHGVIKVDWHSNRLQYAGDISIDWASRYGNDFAGSRSYDWDNRLFTGNWKMNTEHTDSLSLATYGQLPVTGSKSQVLTAGTAVTVTLPITYPNNTYKVNVTPTDALGLGGYVTNKTTTTFDYVLPITTGTVTFDWAVFR